MQSMAMAPEQQQAVMQCAVLVRGFDYGTSAQQIAGYMSGAGTLTNIQMMESDKGSCCVTYSSAEEAQAAVQAFDQTIIPGNSRYLDVAPMDPQQFLARHNIDMDKQMWFMGLNPEQQQAVMGKGSLSSARDPTAVLATRIKQVKGGMGGMGMASGKGARPAGAIPNLGGNLDTKCAVLVRGFDYGTTEGQIAGYMGGAGTLVKIQMFDSGSACVSYSSAMEAQSAIQCYNQTIIPGNRRYLDVSGMDPEEFLAGFNIEQDKAMQFMTLTPEQQMGVMTKGTLSTARDPNAVLATRIKQVTDMGGMGSMGMGMGMAHSSNSFGGGGSSAVGKCAVLVRGFDYGTTDGQIANYMSGAGTIANIQMCDRGSACVTYSSPEEAQAAVQVFNQTTLPGNSRYLDVSGMDPEGFLAGFNIEQDKAMQFMAMSPEQQMSVMAKGSLSTARDPNAVLAVRMGQAGSSSKGSFGPAKGCGGGMKGSAGNSPYGGVGLPGLDNGGCMGQGGKGEGGKMAMLLKVAQMLEQIQGGDWGSNGGSSW